MEFTIINTSFRKDADYAYSLMKCGQYKEARDYMINHMPVIPGYQNAEALWILAQCEYHLGEFGEAQNSIVTILNFPLSGAILKKDTIRLFQSKAKKLQDIINNDSAAKSKTVVFPKTPFSEFIVLSDNAAEKSDVIITRQGLSERIGDYYIKYSIFQKGERRHCNIYLKPISRTEVEVFVFIDSINGIYKAITDDEIVSLVLSRKYPYLGTLIKKGKRGSANDCSLFITRDFAQPPLKDYPLVLGRRALACDSEHVTLEEVESAMDSVMQCYERIVSEIESNPPGNRDNFAIASLAMLKGSLGRAFALEVWPGIKDLLIKVLK